MEGTGGRKPRVRDLNAHLICFLCGGYYVDATTIVECLHSFCRSCIVRHFETSKFCPICDVQVHKAKPLHSIRPDRTLQTLAYKLVPGLYQTEMQRRRSFNTSRGSATEMQCDLGFFSPEDSISLSLEYYDSDKEDEDDEDTSSAGTEIDKKEQKPHRRYLQCPAAVSMKHLKKFIRLKYGLSSEHRVDVIYAGECLKDDFSLMDVAYTFSWKRIAPMRFSYRIFHPPVYVPVATLPTPPKVPYTSSQKPDEQNSCSEKQEPPLSSLHSLSTTVSDNTDSGTSDATETGNVATGPSEPKEEDTSTNPISVQEKTTPTEPAEENFPSEEVTEPPPKKIKLCAISTERKCKDESGVTETKVKVKEKEKDKKNALFVEDKRQRKKRKRSSASSSSEHERRKSICLDQEEFRDSVVGNSINIPVVTENVSSVTTTVDDITSVPVSVTSTASTTDKDTTTTTTNTNTATRITTAATTTTSLSAATAGDATGVSSAAGDVTDAPESVPASPKSITTNATDDVPLQAAADEVEEEDEDDEEEGRSNEKDSCDEPVKKHISPELDEIEDVHNSQEDESVVEDSAGVEDNNITDDSSAIVGGNVVEEVNTAVEGNEENEVDDDVGDLANDDKEDDFTLRMSTSEEEELPEEEVRLATKILPKHPEIKEDKHTKEVEERKKLKGKRDGRKKSKHKSKHHHQESSARKRKAHRAETTPTILQYQEDVMKLKVKLGPIKPLPSHRHHHHHHHSKHNRKAQQEAESSSTAVGVRSNGDSSSTNNLASAKERLLQMRAVRHKNINSSRSTNSPPTNTSTREDVNARSKKTDIIMPPSSITVSKVNIAEKRKLDSQKAGNSSSSNSDDNNKRPSLEIMLVNAPTTTATTASATSTTIATTASTTATVRQSDNITVKQSSSDSPTNSIRTQDHINYKSIRPPSLHQIPHVRIKKSSVTGIRPPAGLTITPKLPNCTSHPTKTTTTISKTAVPNKMVPAVETGGQSKEEMRVVIEEDQTMKHDDIGALDLSGKSSRSKTAPNSPVSSPPAGTGFSSPSSPIMKTTASSSTQSILSIAQSLVHRQLQHQQQHGKINANSSAAKVSSKSPGIDNTVANSHPTTVAAPVYAMSNLKTLSDTAVRIRNEMVSQSDKIIRSPMKMQKPAPYSVQITSPSGTNSPTSITGRASIPVTYQSTNSGISPARSPSSLQHYSLLSNNSVSPLRIPIPPTALSKAATPPGTSSRASNMPRLHEIYPSTQGSLGRGRGMGGVGLQNRNAISNHTKPGPNQAVRHIPNPSALLFRQQQTQNRLQQQQQTQNRLQQQQQQQQNNTAQNKHAAAVSKTLYNNQNNFNNNTSVKPVASTSMVSTAAPPIRKMENMARNIEKVAAGLTVRAVEAHSK